MTNRVSDKLSSAIQTIPSGGSSDATLLGAQLGRDWFVTEHVNFGSNKIRSIARGPDRFVGVGENGVFVHSDDGLSWTMGDMPKHNTTVLKWACVAWAHDRFIASSTTTYNGLRILAYSFDGIQWNAGTTDASAQSAANVLGFCYGNGKYVAVTQATWSALVSEDGVNWTTNQNEDIRGNVVDVTYCGGKFFFTTGSKYIYVTSDFENVTILTPASATATFNNIDSYGDTIVASAINHLLVSKDGGDTWRTIALKTEVGSQIQSDMKRLCANGMWLFIGTTLSNSSDPGLILYTKDFDTWGTGRYPYHYRDECMGMAYGNGMILSVMYNNATPLISIGPFPTDI